jgi:hypothetical protein
MLCLHKIYISVYRIYTCLCIHNIWLLENWNKDTLSRVVFNVKTKGFEFPTIKESSNFAIKKSSQLGQHWTTYIVIASNFDEQTHIEFDAEIYLKS